VKFQNVDGVVMDLSAEKPDIEWYNTFPAHGAVYDLTSTAVSGTDIKERVRAIISLGKSDDPRAVRPLMDLLSDRDPEIRLSSATALGQLKSGRSVEALTGLLKERSEHIAIRQQAAISLAAIRSTGAIREMKEFVADKNEEAAIRSYTEEILAKIGTW